MHGHTSSLNLTTLPVRIYSDDQEYLTHVTKSSDRPGRRRGGWTSPAPPQHHISWQLPFSVPCFALVASRLPSPHQLCFLAAFSCSGFQSADWRQRRELPQCRQRLATWAWGPAGLRPTLSDRWRRQKTEMKKILNFVQFKMRLRWRGCSAWRWIDADMMASRLKSWCDYRTEM